MARSAAAAARPACWERHKAGLALLLLLATAAAAAERPREGSGRVLLDAGADQARSPGSSTCVSMSRELQQCLRFGSGP